jgi:broad specificity phosphatase PhoE
MPAKIYLLRHGESQHNVAMKEYMAARLRGTGEDLEWWEVEDAFDPAIRDAALTERGVAQAAGLRGALAALAPSLLVLSPLTRNLQTADVACQELLQRADSEGSSSSAGGPPLEVLVTPLLREHTYSTCDIGSPPAALAARWPRWAESLGGLPESWWAHDAGRASDSDKAVYREPWQSLQSRAAALAALLAEQSRRHECIVVVGHAVLFFALTGQWMGNCQLQPLLLAELRAPCACAGLACRCPMDFDPQTHT